MIAVRFKGCEPHLRVWQRDAAYERCLLWVISGHSTR